MLYDIILFIRSHVAANAITIHLLTQEFKVIILLLKLLKHIHKFHLDVVFNVLFCTTTAGWSLVRASWVQCSQGRGTRS